MALHLNNPNHPFSVFAEDEDAREIAKSVESFRKMEEGSLDDIPAESLQAFQAVWEDWRPLQPDSERGIVAFETKGTRVRVQITGSWSGGGDSPWVGLRGDSGRSVNNLPHMCLLFLWEWYSYDEPGRIYRKREYATSDYYDFVIDFSDTGPQYLKLTLIANDVQNGYADNRNHPANPARVRVFRH